MIAALLIVTSQFGEVIYRKRYADMGACLAAKDLVTGQGRQKHPGGWVSKDRYAPRAVCVPR
jgi:hypothetical protein